MINFLVFKRNVKVITKLYF